MPSPILKKIKIDDVLNRAISFYKMSNEELILNFNKKLIQIFM